MHDSGSAPTKPLMGIVPWSRSSLKEARGTTYLPPRMQTVITIAVDQGHGG